MNDLRWGVCHPDGRGVRTVVEYTTEREARENLCLYEPGSFLVCAEPRPPLWQRAAPCPIHGAGCDEDPAGCVAAHQAECAAHGLPLLDTGGAS